MTARQFHPQKQVSAALTPCKPWESLTGLRRYCFPHVKLGGSVRLADLNGKWIGVDVSIFLHIICISNDEYIYRTNIEPFYPPTDFLNAFKGWYNALSRHGIKLLLVFDGVEPLVKSIEWEEHNKTRDKADSKLRKIYKEAKTLTGHLSEKKLAEVKKYMKQKARPTDEMHQAIIGFLKAQENDGKNHVCIVMALFEAEWQLVFEEREGRIDGILTEDSNAIALGAENVFVGFNISKLSISLFANKCAKLLPRKARSSKCWQVSWVSSRASSSSWLWLC